MRSRAASRIRNILRRDIPIHTQSIATTLRWLDHHDDGDDVKPLNSTWHCAAFGQVNLFRILFCWRASNKVIVSIWSLLIPVRLTWKPAFETLPSRFGHAVHLKTNACTNKVVNDLCQKLIFYRRRQLSWNEKYKEWTSVNFNSEEAKSWIHYINAGENHKHSVSNFDQMTLAWEWV